MGKNSYEGEDWRLKQTVVLDIGSGKIVCLCGDRVGDDGITVYGAGVRQYAGYRFGEWVDEEDTRNAIIEAISAARRECGMRFREIALSVSAPFVKVHIGEASLEPLEEADKPRRITHQDIDMLINTSLPSEEEFSGYELMHSTPVSFTVDGETSGEIPTMGVQVSARISHAFADKKFLAFVSDVLEEVDLDIGPCIASPLCEALLLISENDRKKPCLLVDVGYTHTDVALVENEAIIALETVEAGGLHFANDLSIGIDIPMSVAEPLKRRYSFGIDYQDSMELLRTPNGTLQVERSFVQHIIEERAKELCFQIGECMEDMGIMGMERYVMHITGGGIALMRGYHEIFERVLPVKVSRETVWMPRLSSPNYMSVYGTLEFLLRAMQEDTGGRLMGRNGARAKKKSLFGFLLG